MKSLNFKEWLDENWASNMAQGVGGAFWKGAQWIDQQISPKKDPVDLRGFVMAMRQAANNQQEVDRLMSVCYRQFGDRCIQAYRSGV